MTGGSREPSGPVVRCEAVTHTYAGVAGAAPSTVLAGVDLEVAPGEAVALVGPSGSGKSTLLTLLAGLVRPTAGRVVVAGTDLSTLSERGLLRLRARHLGVVLQTPGRNVLPHATSEQNVAFAQRSGLGRRERRAEAQDLLASVGLSQQRDVEARRLSGGQQQRLALAVALAGGPDVLLADEPTSQLDRATGAGVVATLLAARDRTGCALVLVTHDHEVSAAMDRELGVHDGRLVAGDPA